jgi:hypothetical protein
MMLISGYLHFGYINPLSCFPQGGNDFYRTPSPLGEGWDGGNNT